MIYQGCENIIKLSHCNFIKGNFSEITTNNFLLAFINSLECEKAANLQSPGFLNGLLRDGAML